MKINKTVLEAMFGEVKNASSLYSPSSYWEDLNALHLEQLIEGGIDNFKRSINMKYFNWGILGILVHQRDPIFKEIKRGDVVTFLKSSFKSYNKKLGNKVTEFDFLSAQIYKFFVAALFNYVKDNDTLGILDKIEEPFEGRPFLIRYNNRKISQDLCNSVHEFYSSTKGLDLSRRLNICDLGAGYGRLGYVFLKTLPKSTYTIVDIPPALYLAQEYLSTIFPKEKIFTFRPFKSFSKVKKEFQSSRIRFLTSNQIEILPSKTFNLVVNVSSLHEMTRNQIKNYIKQIDRIGKGYFYSKQWLRSRYSGNSYIKKEEYQIPKKWKALYSRRHPIQKMFFEALYKIV